MREKEVTLGGCFVSRSFFFVAAIAKSLWQEGRIESVFVGWVTLYVDYHGETLHYSAYILYVMFYFRVTRHVDIQIRYWNA